MSRSYKRKPWKKDDPMRIWGKKFAARRVRREALSEALNTRQRAYYKRFYEQYNIRGYESYWSKEQALNAKKRWGSAYGNYQDMTDEEFLRKHWFPYYRRK